MVMPRQFARRAAIFERELHHAAFGELPGLFAVDFLPRGLAFGHRRDRLLGAAAGDFGCVHQRIAAALVEIDADDVARA